MPIASLSLLYQCPDLMIEIGQGKAHAISSNYNPINDANFFRNLLRSSGSSPPVLFA